MTKRMLTGVAVAAIVSLGATGCTSLIMDTGASGLEEVTIALEPLIGSAAIYLGAREGFFAEEGIELTINSLPASSRSVVGLVNDGHADFGLSDPLALMVGQAAGASVQVLSGAYSTTGDPAADFAGLVVKADSEILTMTDIQGKNVSSPDPRSLDETVLRGLITDAGGNPAGVHFIKLDPAVTVAALESEEVDVAFLVEPYLSWAIESGHRVLNHPYADFDQHLSVAAYFTSAKIDESRPELVSSFAAALKKSLEFAESNPDQVRDIFATYTTTEKGTRTTLSLPKFSAETDRASLEKLGSIAVDNGILFAEPDFDSLLP